MAGYVTPQAVIEGCRKAFDLVDTEQTGVMEIEDLRQGFREMGYSVTKDEMDVVLEASGVWGAQQATMIDYNDFVGLTLEYLKLKGVQEEKEQEALMAFMTLGGNANPDSSIPADRLRDFVKRFELGIDINALITEVDEDGSGALDLKEFSGMLTEKPDATMLAGGYKVKGVPSQDDTWGSPKRKGNAEKKPKANREAKPSVAEDDDEDDDTKIRRTRKRFEFMESLSKQYMNQKRWPPARSDGSSKRTTGRWSTTSEHGLRLASSTESKGVPGPGPPASASQVSTSSAYNRAISIPHEQQQTTAARTGRPPKRSSIA